MHHIDLDEYYEKFWLRLEGEDIQDDAAMWDCVPTVYFKNPASSENSLLSADFG